MGLHIRVSITLKRRHIKQTSHKRSSVVSEPWSAAIKGCYRCYQGDRQEAVTPRLPSCPSWLACEPLWVTEPAKDVCVKYFVLTNERRPSPVCSDSLLPSGQAWAPGSTADNNLWYDCMYRQSSLLHNISASVGSLVALCLPWSTKARTCSTVYSFRAWWVEINPPATPTSSSVDNKGKQALCCYWHPITELWLLSKPSIQQGFSYFNRTHPSIQQE